MIALLAAATLLAAPQDRAGLPAADTARFAAACRAVSLNMQSRIRPDAEHYAVFTQQIEYWDGLLAARETNEGRRDRLRRDAEAELTRASRQGGYMEGMVFVSGRLTVCNQARQAAQ